MKNQKNTFNTMINLKSALTLSVIFLFFSAKVYAGTFREIPIFYNSQKSETEIILQFDDDAGRRDSGFTVEIGKVSDIKKSLELAINSFKKEYKTIVFDFSYTDLGNNKLEIINSFLISKIPLINIKYSLDETDVDLIYEKDIINANKLLGNETKITLLNGNIVYLTKEEKDEGLKGQHIPPYKASTLQLGDKIY